MQARMVETIPDDEISLRRSLTGLLQSLLGSQARIARLEISKHLPDYRVVLVQLEEHGRALVVKMAGPQAPLACPFERTASLLKLVRQRTRVPVAEVLGVDASCQRWPWRYLVTERLPGLAWLEARRQMDEVEQNDCYTQLGEAVTELHAIQFAGYGELPPSLNLPAGRDFAAAWQYRAQAFIPDERLRAAFQEALEPRRDWFSEPGPASLCHEDLHGYNLLFAQAARGWRLSAVLDFDKAWAGCRESDLARLEFWDHSTGPPFWRAYQAGFPIDPGFERRRLLFQLFWCLEYAQSTPRHQADTDRVCRALEIPEVKFNA